MIAHKVTMIAREVLLQELCLDPRAIIYTSMGIEFFQMVLRSLGFKLPVGVAPIVLASYPFFPCMSIFAVGACSLGKIRSTNLTVMVHYALFPFPASHIYSV